MRRLSSGIDVEKGGMVTRSLTYAQKKNSHGVKSGELEG